MDSRLFDMATHIEKSVSVSSEQIVDKSGDLTWTRRVRSSAPKAENGGLYMIPDRILPRSSIGKWL